MNRRAWFGVVAMPGLVLAGGPATGAGQEPLRVEAVVRSALATHPSLEASRSRADAAAAAAGEARAAWWPAVTATGQATRFQEPMVVAPLHGIDPQRPPAFDRTLIQGHVGTEWTLFDGGLRRSRVAGARSLTAAAEAGVEGAADAVIEAAIASYLGVLSARELLSAHEAQLEALESERTRARQMFEEGRAPRVHVLRTEAALSRAAAEREAAVERLSLAVHRLARVAGLEAGRVAGAALVELAPAPGPAPEREALLAEARGRHPAVVAAARRAEAAGAARSAARSTWLPRVAVTARYSAWGDGGGSFDPEWQVGTQLSYPLFLGGARVRATDRAEAELRAARWELGAVTREVEDGVDAALAAYRAAGARAAALEAAVAGSEEVARIEALALEAGAGVQTDYLRAEADLLSARAALAEARHGVAEARVRLARVSGRLDVERLGDLLVEVEP